jgi:hypothetical protein
VQPAPVQPEAGAAFTKGESGKTDFNDNGNGNPIFLDRHNVNCASNGITQFQLTQDDKEMYAYNYSCSSGGALGEPVAKDTGFNDQGDGTVDFLDRHNLDCGKDSVLSQFKLARNDNNQFRFDYTCLPSKKSLTCRDVTTPANQGGSTVNLDKHNVTCNDDEVLSNFQLTRPSATEIAYKYKCCKY